MKCLYFTNIEFLRYALPKYYFEYQQTSGKSSILQYYGIMHQNSKYLANIYSVLYQYCIIHIVTFFQKSLNEITSQFCFLFSHNEFRNSIN